VPAKAGTVVSGVEEFPRDDQQMPVNQDENKRRVAEAALAYVEPGLILGIGTGSTVNFFIDALQAKKVQLEGAVSSSRATSDKLKQARIQELDLNSSGDLEIYFDGADEATRHRALIKGGGGALTREKIVAAASAKFVCMIDGSKLVDVLGRFPVPIEVIPMARSYVARRIVALGGQPVWRQGFTTDNGNVILDVHNLRIADPVAMEAQIGLISGVVGVGLFARRGADVLLVATDTAVVTY
jgi:ribose 5-phosphate isomerase A